MRKAQKRMHRGIIAMQKGMGGPRPELIHMSRGLEQMQRARTLTQKDTNRRQVVKILMRKDTKPMQTRIIRMQKGVLLWLMVVRHTPKGVKHRRPAIIPMRKAKKRWQVV